MVSLEIRDDRDIRMELESPVELVCFHHQRTRGSGHDGARQPGEHAGRQSSFAESAPEGGGGLPVHLKSTTNGRSGSPRQRHGAPRESPACKAAAISG